MKLRQDKDRIRIKETMNDRYKQTKRIVTNCRNNRNISDKEIIEYLAEEIEQYRDKIKMIEKNKNQAIDKVKAIDINSNTVLIFTLKGRIDKEARNKLKSMIEKETKCKCILLGDGIELTNILSKQTRVMKIDTERKIYSCRIDEQDKDYSVTSYYKNRELIKEKIEECNKK